MANTPRIKVSKSYLKEQVQRRKKEVQAEYDEKTAAYPALLNTWQIQCWEKLGEAVEMVRRGELPSAYNNGPLSLPSKPAEPKISLRKYDMDLSLLEAVLDETMEVTIGEFGEYLK
jgi:hypothetical protein